MKYLLLSLTLSFTCLHVAKADPVPPEREKYIRAENAESKKYVSAVGIDPDECLSRATALAVNLDSQVLLECNSQTSNLTTCEITARPISQIAMPIQQIPGYKTYDLVDTKETEESLRAAAITWSEWQSIIECEAKYNAECEVVVRGVVTDFHQEVKRKIPIIGKKETHTVVTGVASAKPLQKYKYSCWAGVEAHAKPFRPEQY